MPPFVEKKYKQFIEKHGYIPQYFNPYNMADLGKNGGYAPCLSTQCGSLTSSATVLIMEKK